jgi:hypothetical protein
MFVKGNLYSKRCDSTDTFISILEMPLRKLGAEVGLQSTSKAHQQEGKADIGVTFAKAGVKSVRSTTKTFTEREFTPSRVSDFLRDKHGLLYIDEADRIIKKQDKIALAELIKLLSDCGSPFKVLIVGIAETAEELTGAHKSVQRCLKETKLGRMSDEELQLIITRGADRAGLIFEPSVIRTIVKLSSGYPHFTHLLALKCAEAAVASDSNTITSIDLTNAIRMAVDDAEGTLKRQYQEATRSYSTSMYKTLLLAAAKLGRDEFTAEALRTKIEEISGERITQGGLNNYLKRLVSNNRSTIITFLLQ